MHILGGAKKVTKCFKEWIWQGLGLHLGGGWHGLSRLLNAFELFFLCSKPNFFPRDQISDRSERFFCAEIVREKVIRQLGKELPYQTSVDIERFEVKGNVTFIDACVFVERQSQKKIIIGERGQKLKNIGQAARIDIEKFIQCKVMLNVWIKVRNGWSNNEDILKSLSFEI